MKNKSRFSKGSHSGAASHVDPNLETRLIRRLNFNPTNPHTGMYMPSCKVSINKHTHLCERRNMPPQSITVSLLHRNKLSVLKIHHPGGEFESLLYFLSLLAFFLSYEMELHPIHIVSFQLASTESTVGIGRSRGSLVLEKKMNKRERGK